MASDSEGSTQTDSDSLVQRRIEAKVIQGLGLESQAIKVDGVEFQFDGVSASGDRLVEVYAGTGHLKSAQRMKISQDILKLVLFEKLMQAQTPGVTFKKQIAVVDPAIHQELSLQEHRSWKNMAFEAFGVEVILHELGSEDRQALVEAKERQGYRFKKK
jgi:hypothetical protein